MFRNLIWILLVPTCAAVAAPALPDTPDIARQAWYLGLPVQMNVLLSSTKGGHGPAAASDDYPDLKVYLTAPVMESGAIADHIQSVPTPQGMKALPLHDDTLAGWATLEQRADTIGYLVGRGPKATKRNVRTRKNPPNSLFDIELASAIKVGGIWTKLNSHHVIDYGIAHGLLEAHYFDYGGVQWHTEINPGEITKGAFRTAAPSVDQKMGR